MDGHTCEPILRDNPEAQRWAVDNAWLFGPVEQVVPAMRSAYTTIPNDKSFTIWFSMALLRELPDMAFSLQSEIYRSAMFCGTTLPTTSATVPGSTA